MQYLLFQVDFIGPREPLKEPRVRSVGRSDLTGRKRWTLAVTVKVFAIGGLENKNYVSLSLWGVNQGLKKTKDQDWFWPVSRTTNLPHWRLAITLGIWIMEPASMSSLIPPSLGWSDLPEVWQYIFHFLIKASSGDLKKFLTWQLGVPWMDDLLRIIIKTYNGHFSV